MINVIKLFLIQVICNIKLNHDMLCEVCAFVFRIVPKIVHYRLLDFFLSDHETLNSYQKFICGAWHRSLGDIYGFSLNA